MPHTTIVKIYTVLMSNSNWFKPNKQLAITKQYMFGMLLSIKCHNHQDNILKIKVGYEERARDD